MIKLSYEQQIAFNSLSIIVGNALYALTVVLFLVPSGLITGGATGIALGINRALGLPVSGVLFVINMTMLTVGWVLLGRRFAITTIASTVLSPLFLALWERVFTGFVLTDDLVLNTIFAGLGVGISLGITIRAGASTGGMDIPPLVLNKYFHIPVSASMLVFDMLILCLQAAFSPLQQCLYGIVMVIVYTVVLDKVLIFGTTRTEVKIISQHADDIREAIFTQLDRGVTVLHGEGGYSHEPEQVLLSIVSNRQLPKLEKLAHAIGLVAWGYVFLYFNLTLGSLNIIPNWVCYLLIGKAIGQLKDASPAIALLSPLSILLAALELCFWVFALIGIDGQNYFLKLLGLLLAILSLYFHFQLLTDLVALLQRAGISGTKKLLLLRTVRTVLAAVMALPIPWQNSVVLTVIVAVSGVVVGLWVCVVLVGLRKALLQEKEA